MNKKLSFIALFSAPFFALLSVPAFAAINDNPADADSWFDITVLTAKVDPSIKLKQFDHVENCDKVTDQWVDNGRAGRHHYENFDCSNYISHQLNAGILKPLPLWQFDNGQLSYQTTDALNNSPIVVVETVIPVDRLALADAVGFSESFMGGRVNLVKANGPDAKTFEVRKVTLKDGRIGIVHRWIGELQSHGHGDGIDLRSLPFKPVLVRYQNGDTLRYWDPLIGKGMFKDYNIQNYKYGQPGPHYVEAVEPNTYDRSAEVLQ